jgi:hypothetical protein
MLINYIPLDIQFPLKFAALDKVPEVSICDGEFAGNHENRKDTSR